MEDVNELIGILQAKYMESQESEERLNLVVQQIAELEEFSRSLDALKETESDEILASLGKSVYFPATIKEKELFIGVGSGIFVKKKIDEAKEVIKNQISGLIEMRINLVERAGALDMEMQELIKSIEGKN
ncbi:prefoldin subunit alpha [Candidatus Pacearchaeota archaeon CG_4_9_14_0_2_um_filter_39_13]|nr:prefoldin subunit alpha [Candidatus Pacearchaeota archaeon]OIO43539.1 MAG: prefoldin subunit alpha [Candidatus Pacearchaeota archaeon CG1_02_39_14]PJC44339.1 MAG: prefoldin subunit alpha [Candidatus Pacearchaeota archaeon CG_4_9_14_0_2_um_filter_39_13]